MTASLDVISMGTYSHPAVRRDMESEIRGKKEVEVSSRGKVSSLGLAIPGWPCHPHLPSKYPGHICSQETDKGADFLSLDQCKAQEFSARTHILWGTGHRNPES